MLPPSKQQVLRLYKHLIRYGNQLQLTDKSYFLGRVRREFRENSKETEVQKIQFSFKVRKQPNISYHYNLTFASNNPNSEEKPYCARVASYKQT